MSGYLYRHFDKKGTLLYVGITNNIAKRIIDHKKDSDWFENVANITIQHFKHREDAIEVEKKTIIKEKPLHNICHANNKRGNRNVSTTRRVYWVERGEVYTGWRERVPVGHKEIPDQVLYEGLFKSMKQLLLDSGGLPKTVFAEKCKSLGFGVKKARKLIDWGEKRFWETKWTGKNNEQFLSPIK